MLKRIAVTALCVASLSGCASFISGGTGTAPVGTDSGVRSLGQVFIDSSIKRTANINLYKLDQRFKQSRINIESFHSTVLLTGQVPDPYLKQLAEDNVKAMSDVKAVHNYITVGNKVSYNTIMQDAGVTANTRALLMKAPVVSDSKVLVHTEDGVLYVMGRLNTAEINDLNNVLQNVGNVTKIVTLIDNIDLAPTPAVSTASATTTPVINNVLAQPTVQTPVAIDPDQTDPASSAQ
ncbi:BON domain-containing protein [Acinetobacter baumannii]|uniref:BON domain-containing protein n=1 Tax=Acinetobacter baumannii TaxID=470 RepID=UPI0010FD3F54|nr:BON domain-containing protein [Acinetobacter baumannii]MDK1592190.1 BON domain-containing protein [Acinetobacter baumannii]MDV2220519.1 BON domain-containing protein [Acinetobacter baumannii]MDV2941984.1 BON domain-containing protein [Acinetobacter baumannii]MZX71636.1 BON domain-containing protein [Acinetobacter baumannii]MZY89439.1 BON domain-containing protein [Acinetobacter baumannii]